MPANRKPAGQRQDNRPQRALAPVPVTAGEEGVEPAPRGWLKATKTAWAAFWTSEVAGAVTPADRHGLLRLFRLRDMQLRAFNRYEKQPYVDGSMGQPVANPALADAMTLEKAVLALEDRLGLSPKARANLGLAFGQAKLTAAELNRMAKEPDDGDVGEVVDAELASGWEAAN